ncbi:MAG: twitching motility protein PilT [Lachnospiraceae bacterium]|nr:twitching motility protein PilT [Lachnospiraceae bacterium]
MSERKFKVYLDTSVISYLKQDDAPEKTGITLNLWEKFKAGIYDVCISQITIDEMNECPEPKLTFLKNKLREIKYTCFKLDDDCFELAKEIITKGILKQKH